MYFNMFPKILYTLDDGSSAQVIQDVTRRIILSPELKNNNSLYDLYDVRDGETPELVADRFYKNPMYHWVVLHANDIIDPRFDWPLSQVNLIEYCKTKYGSDNVYSTHHFIDGNGYEVNSDAVGATSISNFGYEDSLNESKRRIKVIKSEVVAEIINSFESLINE